METPSPFESFNELHINTQAKAFLRETAKWANFLSILGYIGSAIIVLAALFMLVFGVGTSAFSDSFVPGFMSAGIAIMYLVIGLLYFMPIYYLNRFANFMRSALDTNDNQKLTDALGYLKSHYKFIGIFTLIFIGIYVLIFVFAIIGAGFSAFN